jgi:hypothetical protein
VVVDVAVEDAERRHEQLESPRPYRSGVASV